MESSPRCHELSIDTGKPLASTNQQQLSTFSKEVVPDSTEVNPDKNFSAWADRRCAAEPNDTVPSDILLLLLSTNGYRYT